MVVNATQAELSHFLLIYREQRRFGAIVVKAPTLAAALMQAANAGLDRPNTFRFGQQLDAGFVALIRPQHLGRILTVAEARELLAAFEARYREPPLSRYLPAAE
jgi:hypothetical protein